jgi:4-amino-4-deoxy-L-arabinose transferase-like glycosyltransferase
VTAAAWSIVALVVVLRLAAAFTLPLTGDEAYYWEWSRRLAAGYGDHPPGVAWTIAAFAWLGKSAGVIRLGFVLCGAVAALATGACVARVTGDRRSGAIAAAALTLAPLGSIAFGIATPDGPYLMFWALALLFAVRAFADDRVVDWLALGLAIAGCVLSRAFGLALAFGIVAYSLGAARRGAWRRGMPVALGAAFVACLPFVVWNAQHGWATFAFAVVHRHQETREFTLPAALAGQLAAYSPGIFVAVIAAAIGVRRALFDWTALPLLLLVDALSIVERVEIYWIFGPFVSLCALAGAAFATLGARARRWWIAAAAAPAALLLALLFAFCFAPAHLYDFAVRVAHVHLRNGGPFEIMTYPALAAEAGSLARERNAIVMTDGYGLSSILDYYAGLAPVVVGYDWQGRESHAWFPDAERPRRALFVDKEPLSGRPDLAKHLAQACGRVVDGGKREYAFAGAPPRPYWFTWCEGMAPDGLAIMRFEHDPTALQ